MHTNGGNVTSKFEIKIDELPEIAAFVNEAIIKLNRLHCKREDIMLLMPLAMEQVFYKHHHNLPASIRVDMYNAARKIEIMGVPIQLSSPTNDVYVFDKNWSYYPDSELKFTMSLEKFFVSL